MSTLATQLGRVLVTGGTGFVGGHLLPRLQAEGVAVRVLSRRAAPVETSFEWVRGDLTARESLRPAVAGVDTVLHLGGYAHAMSRPDPAELERHRRINLEGTAALAEAAAEAGARRFVLVSSVKAAGEDPEQCIDEDDTRMPRDPYGAVKRLAEERVLVTAAARGMAASVLRPALVYGPGVKGNLAAMMTAIARGRFPPVPETGNVRSMVDVRDLVEAILAAATRPEAAGGTFIITDGEAYSTRRIYLAMCAALGRRPPRWSLPAGLLRFMGRLGDAGRMLTGRDLPIDSTRVRRLLDSACYRSVRAEEALGFHPRRRLEDALPEMVAALATA